MSVDQGPLLTPPPATPPDRHIPLLLVLLKMFKEAFGIFFLQCCKSNSTNFILNYTPDLNLEAKVKLYIKNLVSCPYSVL